MKDQFTARCGQVTALLMTKFTTHNLLVLSMEYGNIIPVVYIIYIYIPFFPSNNQ